MATAGLTWLHLSDWHQKGMDFDRKVVRDALVDDIKKRRDIHPDLEYLDFMVFSGDLAFNGKKEEYQAAAEHFLAPVLAAAELDKSRLFIVPGNHDLDRDSFELLPPGIQKPLTDAEKIKYWLEDNERRERMLSPFKAFNEFVNSYADGNFSAYAGSRQLTIGGKTIALLGFNSALMCGRNRDKKKKIDDKGKIMVGEPQVYELLKKHGDADLRIVVLHHPFDWLTEQDCNGVEIRLKKEAHFILCGHQHRPKVTIETGTDGSCILIPAGASYDRRKVSDQQYNNSYNFVHLDFENQKGEVFLRCWSDRNNRWREDIDACSNNGRFAFPFPKGISTLKSTKPSYESITLEETDKNETTVTRTVVPAVNYHPDNPVFNVPFRAKGDGMVGREEALQKVREQLTAGQQTAIGYTAAFQGLGGLGKTQLAVEYAHRFRDEYPLGVLWINADQEIEPQLIEMAKQGCWIHPDSKPQDILEIAKQRLQNRSECLVIFDNVEDRAAIEPYLPVVDAEPHLLLTSRAFQEGFVLIDIALLDEALSFQLLLKESGRDINSLSELEQKAGREIVDKLGGLPLAIEIAGAYLNHLKGCTFQSYRDFLAENLREAMKGVLLSSFTGHEKDLFLTLQVSKPVLAQAPLLNDILDILAWSGTAFMGISLLAALLGKTEAELFTPLHLGESLHLLQKTPEKERYDIHRLVRQVRQEQSPLTQREQWIKEVCQRLGDWFEERIEEFTHLPAFEAEMDHLKQWLEHVRPYHSVHSARLTWLQMYPPYYWGKYREAQQLVQSAFTLLSENSEEDLRLKANILNDLGTMYLKLGENQKALENQMQSLEIRQILFGEQHPDTTISYNNVGSIHVAFGNYEKALEYKLRALKICLQIFGKQHPITSTILNNVGGAYGDLGEQEKALEYQLQALEIQKQLFGEQHPITAAIINNVGDAYGNLNKHEKALEYKLRALEILRKLLGERHPDTASLFQSVGYTYLHFEKPKEALDYFIQAFDIRYKLLGALHQETVGTFGTMINSFISLKEKIGLSIDEYLKCVPQDHSIYKVLSGLKKLLQNEKRKNLHGMPGKKKKRKR
ncbi:MAG: tetratricopeptide repeat protein [Candidatus Aminicenantes bacterium]|nr:tetratricopeptide repeat protein [Candidatus Aminicenantes bacterium]